MNRPPRYPARDHAAGAGLGRRLLAPIGLGLAAAAVAVSVLLVVRRPHAAGPALPPPSAARSLPSHPSAAKALAPSPPVRLEIPEIGVDTPLMPLGLNPDHTLEVPPLSRAQVAGWYRLGATPGAKGTAVIAGHVDSTAGPAVFFKLGRLRPGDVFRVGREDGRTARFAVDSVETVPKSDFPTGRVYGRVGYAAIRLITCGGTFDRSTGHYNDNIVVYGHLIAAS